MTRTTTATRRRGDGEQGVSTVLGAILMFGLLVVTLVTIQTKFVPVWDHQREADHMQQVQSQLATLKADLDRQADNRSFVPVTDPLTLSAPAGFRFFSSSNNLPGSVSFAPAAAGGGFTVSSPQVHVLSQNGQSAFAGSETWNTIVTSTLSNVSQVQHLRLRIANPTTYTTGNSVTLSLTDANGQYAGKLYVFNIDHGPTYTFEFDTYAATSQSTPTSTVQLNYDKQNPPVYQYYDLLVPTFQFQDVLNQVTAPFTVSLAKNVMQADYAIAYTLAGPGGSTQVGGGGKLVSNFASNLAGGSLTYKAPNQQFPAQTYVVEHGAVLLSQADGNVMVVPPQFSARLVAGQVNLNWVVPALTGGANNIVGPDVASVTIGQSGSSLDLLATAPSLNLTLTTLYPAQWTQFWSTQMQLAGLTTCTPIPQCQPQFYTSSTATTATLRLFGVTSDPASTVDDILFHFKGASVGVGLAASGQG